MAALCNRAGHYIFALWFLSSSIYLLLFSSPNLSGRRVHGCLPYFDTWCGLTANLDVLQGARWKYRTEKWCQKLPSKHHRTTLSGYIFATKACIDNRKNNLLSSNISSTCPHNMVIFGRLAAEICWRVWGTPANFNGFCVLAALLHGI